MSDRGQGLEIRRSEASGRALQKNEAARPKSLNPRRRARPFHRPSPECSRARADFGSREGFVSGSS
eukprot:8440459-Alexandrium_andersonii.AAC.1